MRTTTLLAALLIAPAAMAQTVAPAQPISSAPLVNTPGLPYGPAGTVPAQPTTPAYIGQTGSIPPAMIPAPAQPPVNAAPAAPAGGSFGLGKLFDEADINHDNAVTREEFIAKANIHFGMADKNKDNKITREEMQAQQGSFMQQMQQNIFGNGGWQGKMQQFMGAGQPPVAPVPYTPTLPSVVRPTPPAAPTTTTY